jgi:transposase
MAGPGLLAYILTSKFDDHLPLYRLNEIFTRMGADIPDTTLVDWCGRAMKTLQPVIELIGKEIMASDLLHADDTPIRVLDRSQKDKGLGKGVRQGRIWVYVRNQRRRTKGAPLAQRAGTAPPGAVYRFSPDRKGKHPKDHLKHSRSERTLGRGNRLLPSVIEGVRFTAGVAHRDANTSRAVSAD